MKKKKCKKKKLLFVGRIWLEDVDFVKIQEKGCSKSGPREIDGLCSRLGGGGDVDQKHRAFIYVKEAKRFDPHGLKGPPPRHKKSVAVGFTTENHPSKGAKRIFIYLWEWSQG